MNQNGITLLQAPLNAQDAPVLPTDILLKRHPRRKHLAFQVATNGCLKVFAPAAWSLNRIKGVLRENEAHILAAASEAKAISKVSANREWQWLLGEPYRIELSSISSLVLDLENHRLSVPAHWHVDQEQKAYQLLLKQRARPILQERLQYCATKFGDDLPGFRLGRVGTPSSRWGSCSRSGNINLSALLLQYPESCIDYVITHELCHLYEFNHSKAFYKRLSVVMPDWKAREAWFRWPLPMNWESLRQDKRAELVDLKGQVQSRWV
jgi:predicted metal-dependent hydrolase